MSKLAIDLAIAFRNLLQHRRRTLFLGGAIAAVGIPAKSDVQFFFFSGPRLRPDLNIIAVVVAFVIVIVVATVSSFYPAWLAMRVTPRQAMQEDE